MSAGPVYTAPTQIEEAATETSGPSAPVGARQMAVNIQEIVPDGKDLL